MASEQFSLCWDNFHRNMSSGMNSLLESEELVDVTLAVEGRYLKAHKMVLSVCSPYFKELFRSNPCKHPIVFMKDVSYTAMSDLLQFMYQGEVQVSQENLTTFIKTAEGLQIKGLTGDGNISTESDAETPQEVEKVTVDSDKLKISSSMVRSRKSHAPLVSAAPSLKRQRMSVSSERSTATHNSAKITKEEVKSAIAASSMSNSDSLIQFKLEPFEQNQAAGAMSIGEDDNFVENLEETNAEDAEDYSAMEGGDDEPQAGTSMDGVTGEGQDDDRLMGVKKKAAVVSRNRLIANGFVYHKNLIRGSPPVRYLGCAEQKSLLCRARAIMPMGGTLDQLIVTQPHNHPPDLNVEEKDAFLKELKRAVRVIGNDSLRKVYEVVSQIYPKGAEEISFASIKSSMHRWRRTHLP